MAPDGVWEHHIRQSDIGRFRKCPELHRRHMAGTLPTYEGDAALIGTACHAGAHHALVALMQWLEPDYDECLQVAMQTLEDGWNADSLHQVQIRSLTEAAGFVQGCFLAWWSHFLDQFEPDTIHSVEQPFDVLAMRGPLRRVYLTGTYDVRFYDQSLVDWKFPKDTYVGSNEWKHQRYDHQPTHYQWASMLLAGYNPLLMQRWDGKEGLAARDDTLPGFTYGVILRERQVPEELDIIRTYGDVQFYAQELSRLCDLIEAQLPQWPLNATDWWCSDKWCEAWDSCRGMYLPTDPWGLMAKVGELTGNRVTSVKLGEPQEGDAFDGLPTQEWGEPSNPRWDDHLAQYVDPEPSG